LFSGRKYSRKKWTHEERLAVLKKFGPYISKAKVPGKPEIERLMQNEPALAGRK